MSADGNHSLHKKTKKDDPNDMALTTGQGYFTPHSAMATYLETKYKRKRAKKGAAGEVATEDDPPVSDCDPPYISHS